MAEEDKGKGLLALMVGSPKKATSDGETDDAEPTNEKADAVKEFFAAGKSGDFDEASLHLERFIELCGAYEDEEEEELEEE